MLVVVIIIRFFVVIILSSFVTFFHFKCCFGIETITVRISSTFHTFEPLIKTKRPR
jgi:hypothetical protein